MSAEPTPEDLAIDVLALLAACEQRLGLGWTFHIPWPIGLQPLPAVAGLCRRTLAAEAFKCWVHQYLDAHGVPHHPPGTHGAEGCRIGDRMDWLMAKLAASEAEVASLKARQLSPEQLDELLERWDQTEPALQRQIVARAIQLRVEADDEVARLRALMNTDDNPT